MPIVFKATEIMKLQMKPYVMKMITCPSEALFHPGKCQGVSDVLVIFAAAVQQSLYSDSDFACRSQVVSNSHSAGDSL